MSDMDAGSAGRGSVLIAGVGAVQGLGAAIARRFSAGGYPVVVAGRSGEKLAAVVEVLNGLGGDAIGVVGDVTDAADVARFVAAAQAAAR